MKAYLDQCRYILDNGIKRMDRTGTGTLDCFGYQARYDLSDGFPIVTTKKLFLKGVIFELLWFIKGETNIKYLVDNGVHIWDEWADQDGNLGDVYGRQWRSWPTADGRHIDQLQDVVGQIKNNPDSRRMIVNSWNVGEISKMALPPCHMIFQFYVLDGKLSCQLYQRSSDMFLGVPFNIASYALLTQMVAQVCNLELGDFVHTFGSHHIYLNHIDQVKQQLGRKPYPLPIMKINPDVRDITEFRLEDFELGYGSAAEKELAENYGDDANYQKYRESARSRFNYVCHPRIKGDVSK